VRQRQFYLLLTHRGADVTGNIEVVALLGDTLHADALGVAFLLLPGLVGIDDLGDVFVRELVLTFAFHEVLGGVYEEYVVRFLAFLEHEDADRYASRVEQVRGQADDGVNVTVFEQLCANALLCPSSEQHTMRQNDGHHALILQIVETMQEKREVSG